MTVRVNKKGTLQKLLDVENYFLLCSKHENWMESLSLVKTISAKANLRPTSKCGALSSLRG